MYRNIIFKKIFLIILFISNGALASPEKVFCELIYNFESLINVQTDAIDLKNELLKLSLNGRAPDFEIYKKAIELLNLGKVKYKEVRLANQFNAILITPDLQSHRLNKLANSVYKKYGVSLYFIPNRNPFYWNAEKAISIGVNALANLDTTDMSLGHELIHAHLFYMNLLDAKIVQINPPQAGSQDGYENGFTLEEIVTWSHGLRRITGKVKQRFQDDVYIGNVFSNPQKDELETQIQGLGKLLIKSKLIISNVKNPKDGMTYDFKFDPNNQNIVTNLTFISNAGDGFYLVFNIYNKDILKFLLMNQYYPNDLKRMLGKVYSGYLDNIEILLVETKKMLDEIYDLNFKLSLAVELKEKKDLWNKIFILSNTLIFKVKFLSQLETMNLPELY